MEEKIQKPRLFYLDNLKVILTILVIIHHVGQAYGPTGGYWDFLSKYRVPILGTFFTINASFFMGLFFFISAYFFPGSYDRHGAKKFIKDRLLRYGVPVLFGFFVIVPLDQYYSFITWRSGLKISFFQYLSKAYFNFGLKPDGIIGPMWPELNFGHLWFIQHLLVYTFIFVFIQWIIKLFRKSNTEKKISNFIPGIGTILFYSVIAAYFTGIVRLFYPIDKWVPFLYFIQMEPAHLVSYAFSFIAGILAYRNQWLERISKKVGWVLLGIGFIMSLFLVYVFITKNNSIGKWFDDTRFLYETIMGMCLSFGLVLVGKYILNYTNNMWRFLSSNAYAAYIFHFPIAIFFQVIMEKVPPYNPLSKFLLVSLLSVTFTFIISNLIRKIPGFRKVLG
jgi:glucans biosynthesis protein C